MAKLAPNIPLYLVARASDGEGVHGDQPADVSQPVTPLEEICRYISFEALREQLAQVAGFVSISSRASSMRSQNPALSRSLDPSRKFVFGPLQSYGGSWSKRPGSRRRSWSLAWVAA